MKTCFQPPLIILVMGVSGCGKSTVAEKLAARLNASYVDADDFHSEQAKKLMASGTSLTDEQREPWILRLCDYVQSQFSQQNSVVLACSLLRKAHRERFYNLGLPMTLVFLQGDFSLIEKRLSSREGHFFPASLLRKQLEDLQVPVSPEPVLSLNVAAPVDELVESAYHHIVKNLS